MIMGAQYRFSLIYVLGLLTLVAGAIVIVLAGLAMAGWIFGFGVFDSWLSLRSGHSGAVSPGMSPDAALCFILCGIALWVLRDSAESASTGKAPTEKFLFEAALIRASLIKTPDEDSENALESYIDEMDDSELDKLKKSGFSSGYSRRLAQLSASIAAAIAVAGLAGYLFGWDASVGGWLAQLAAALGHWSGQGAITARMAPSAALAFLLNGVALTMLDVETRRGARPAQHLALIALFLSIVVALGHIYQVSSLYSIFTAEGWPEMTALTAGIFVALSIGVVCARPRSGLMSLLTSQSVGGTMAWRMLPAAILAPVALGWLQLFGEKVGYFDRPFGTSLLVLSSILFFIILIWRSAAAMHKLDNERVTAESALYKAYTDVQRRLGEQTAELMRANQDLWAEMIERERLEGDLWRDREELADIFENAPVCAHRISPDGIILWANQTDLHLLGYSRNEYVGHHMSEFHADPSVVDEMLGRLWQGEDLDNYEVHLRAKDGSIRLVQISSNSLWKDNNLVYAHCYTRDITESRLIEDSLLESEKNAWLEVERAEAIYQASPIGMALVDYNLRYVRVNQVMGEMLGQVSGLPLERIIGVTSREFAPQLAGLTETHFSRVFGGGESLVNIELRPKTAAGAGVERDWLASFYPLKDSDGVTLGVNVVAQDITERKQTELRLQERDALYQRIVDCSRLMVWMSGPDRVLNFFNKGWLDYTGRRLEQELENGWVEGVHPEDFARCLETYVEAFNVGSDFEMEHRLRRRDGEYRWVLNHGAPWMNSDGTLAGYIGFCLDIHERREAEDALRSSEEFSRGILENSADRIEALNLDGKLISMNRRGLKIMEIDDFSMYAGADWVDLWESEWRDGARQAIEAAKTGAEGRFTGSCKTMKGALKWWEAMVSLARDRRGNPTCLVAILRDITETREIENERDDLLSRERVAREEAEDANRLKDEFLATVSHELRAPLNAIQGWVKLLRNGKLNPEEAARALETVERSTRAQNRIISDLLDVSRIITGKLRLNVRPLQPSVVIESVVDSLAAAAEAKEISIELALDREAGPISGDSDRLRQILWNLIANAIKFSYKQGRVEVKLERVGSNVEITVSDMGAGIASDFLPYVFDRFRQGDGSSTRRQGGLGLGLAIVRHLTEMHGGSVRAESAGVDQGAAFSLKFPLITQAQFKDHGWKQIIADGAGIAGVDARARLNPPGMGQAPELGGLRVLAVDDDSDARDLIKTILTQCGAVVETANSIGQALAVFERPEEWQPELLISDIEMPEADGYQLIRKLREIESERERRIPAIALTARARVEDRLRSLSAGFQMHVTKPVEPEELLTIVASLTGRLGKPRSLFEANDAVRQEVG
jgi:PAS domain S-box-containing protein